MSRFLMVSFAGLALAFYELSGGADFTPPAHPTTDTQIQQATDSDTRNRIISRPAETQLATPVLTPIPRPSDPRSEPPRTIRLLPHRREPRAVPPA